jgi:hypothetical protein
VYKRTSSTVPAPTQVLTLTVPSIDLNLLGLEVKTDPIVVTISAQSGNGKLLGNVISSVTSLLNTQAIGNALNTVLGQTVSLLNQSTLNVPAGTGTFSNENTTTTIPVLNLQVAPVHLDLLGVLVDTQPIHLSITAHTGQGLILGNVVYELSKLLDPPLPNHLDVATLNQRLQQLLTDLNNQLPGIAPATSPPPVLGPGQFLALTVPALNVNLLGLLLKTDPITINATDQTGNGELLGNLLTVVFNTLGATPDELSQLNGNINNLLAKVIGVLNVASLTLPAGALGGLSGVLQTLSLPNLLTSQTSAQTPILDLLIASNNSSQPPVNVDLMGLLITTSNIHAQLLAQTGDGELLGNLLYNVANLLNPGNAGSLLFLLSELA